MSIGQRIKAKRIEMSMSAEELGKRLGKNRATIYRYEKGDIENLPLDILEPIAEVLHTTPQYLMGWEQEQVKNDALADIIIRLRTDDNFFMLVKQLADLDQDKLSSLQTLLK